MGRCELTGALSVGVSVSHSEPPSALTSPDEPFASTFCCLLGYPNFISYMCCILLAGFWIDPHRREAEVCASTTNTLTLTSTYY